MVTISASKTQENSVKKLLDECPEVRPFPAVVTQLLAAIQNPDAKAATIAGIIECDPALAIRLLRMANSPLYGLRTEIQSIEHACTVLGMRPLKTLALTVAGVGMFSEGSGAQTERNALWSHSLGCATVARLLARTVPSVSSDQAFLAGVFHDVGKLLFFDLVPSEYSNLTQIYSASELTGQEQARFETTHELIGMKSAHSWNLSESVKVAIGYHHRPEESPNHFDLAAIVNVADGLARTFGVGSAGTPYLDVSDHVIQELGLSQDVLAGIHDESHAAYKEITNVCK